MHPIVHLAVALVAVMSAYYEGWRNASEGTSLSLGPYLMAEVPGLAALQAHIVHGPVGRSKGDYIPVARVGDYSEDASMAVTTPIGFDDPVQLNNVLRAFRAPRGIDNGSGRFGALDAKEPLAKQLCQIAGEGSTSSTFMILLKCVLSLVYQWLGSVLEGILFSFGGALVLLGFVVVINQLVLALRAACDRGHGASVRLSTSLSMVEQTIAPVVTEPWGLESIVGDVSPAIVHHSLVDQNEFASTLASEAVMQILAYTTEIARSDAKVAVGEAEQSLAETMTGLQSVCIAMQQSRESTANRVDQLETMAGQLRKSLATTSEGLDRSIDGHRSALQKDTLQKDRRILESRVSDLEMKPQMQPEQAQTETDVNFRDRLQVFAQYVNERFTTMNSQLTQLQRQLQEEQSTRRALEKKIIGGSTNSTTSAALAAGGTPAERVRTMPPTTSPPPSAAVSSTVTSTDTAIATRDVTSDGTDLGKGHMKEVVPKDGASPAMAAEQEVMLLSAPIAATTTMTTANEPHESTANSGSLVSSTSKPTTESQLSPGVKLGPGPNGGKRNVTPSVHAKNIRSSRKNTIKKILLRVVEDSREQSLPPMLPSSRLPSNNCHTSEGEPSEMAGNDEDEDRIALRRRRLFEQAYSCQDSHSLLFEEGSGWEWLNVVVTEGRRAWDVEAPEGWEPPRRDA